MTNSNGATTIYGRLYNDVENVLAAVRIPILMVDHDLRIRRFTPAAEHWLNLRPSDIGRPVTDLRGVIALPQLGDLVRTTIDLLSVQNIDVQDQQGAWWSLSIRPYRTEEHRIEGAVLAFVDTNSLKRSLESAEQSKQYAEAVTETVREPLVVLGPDYRIARANAAFYEMFRISPVEAEGRPVYRLREGWDIPQMHNLLKTVTETSQPQEGEVECRLPGIGNKTFWFTGRRIITPESSGQAILLAIEDVTEQRRAEKALIRSNEELQRFAYVVAHDLQEPLRTISSFIQLLERKYPVDAESTQLMQFVVDGAGRMQAMIGDLLSFSRVATSEPEAATPVSPTSCLQEAIWSLQATIQAEEATIRHDDFPAAIRYHPQQLTQLFQNLIGNALKYRRAEAPAIYISAERRDGEWIFSVRDNGLGFAPADAERIFHIFKRLHGREYPGTGIGLAICNRIVERHGGRIWARSEPGKGSTFFFTVPI